MMSLDKQAVFDIVATHLLTQMEKSYDEIEGECRYRQGGLMCAIGRLIPDEFYSEELEGEGVNSLPVRKALYKAGYTVLGDDSQSFLGELQGVHDVYSPTQWKANLARLAKSYSINPKVLENF